MKKKIIIGKPTDISIQNKVYENKSIDYTNNIFTYVKDNYSLIINGFK